MPTPFSRSARPERSERPSRVSPGVLAVTLITILLVYAAGYVRTAPARQSLGVRPSLASAFRDGSWVGWGRARHGRVSTTVRVVRGRIVSAEITDCRMKYPCSMIAALPVQVVTRQGGDVDIVSGATHSTEAFARAIHDALLQASRTGRDQ